ncbi:MAG TPA: pantoate--beta-alanine ligase [Sphingobacteriaceae bacterium]|nr:pantoate--beta-alanine ligase [Sphingobacteriaceae bacterium]
MKIFTAQKTLSEYLLKEKKNGRSIGFVPTMGALHNGHLSLINGATEKTDLVVVSIFVNPTQFNDAKDLVNYPRPLDADLAKLNTVKCDVLFMPEVSEMYSENEYWEPDLDGLDIILEGKQRPGHYKGVTQIVNKLFNVVKPDIAFFGQKDYQQFLVISKLISITGSDIELVMCPIIREKDGLAMSSRNVLLSEEERQIALILSGVLNQAKKDFDDTTIVNLKSNAITSLKSTKGLSLDYFEVCDAKSLQPVINKNKKDIIALVAASIGSTRLIDNIILR